MSEKQSNKILELQMKVEELAKAKSYLKARLSRTEADLEKHDDLASTTSSQYTNELSLLQTKLSEQAAENYELKAKVDLFDSVLEQKQRESHEAVEKQIKELQASLDAEAKEKRSLRSKINDFEAELARKEKQIRDIVDRYTMEITQLESDLADHKKENGKLKNGVTAVTDVISDANNLKNELISAEKARKESEDKLSEQIKANAALKREVDNLKSDIMKTKRVLERNPDNKESENERKELEMKLVEETSAKAALEEEVERLRKNANRFSGATTEASKLRIQLSTLEKSVEAERELARAADESRTELEAELVEQTKARAALAREVERLQDEVRKLSTGEAAERNQALDADTARIKGVEGKMAGLEKTNEELEARLAKVSGERTEVITALEEVINEVQSREDEIEALANILRKRDEELEHAKLIATKALASAQDAKARYKGKGQERQAELNDKISMLTTNVNLLTEKNEILQRQTSKVERKLQEKEAECAQLKERLRSLDNNAPEKRDKLDEFIERNRSPKIQNFGDGFATFDTESPTHSDPSLEINDSMSTQSADLQGASGWLHDFDSQSIDSSEATSFAGIRTEPSESQSRRSIERDALRKYVRKRYLKSKTSV
jgi:chromosome segregation ATPase